MKVTERALAAGSSQAQAGGRLSDISHAVEGAATEAGLHVVKEFVGHGVGRKMHEEPSVPNYVDPSLRHRDVVLRPGMAICIEPMVNQGRAEVMVLDDGWTVVTRDGSLSAHFEHTIGIRASGAEVMTVL